MYVISGALIKAGWSPEIIDMLKGDPAVAAGLEAALTLAGGVLIGAVSLAWRKLALRFGWST